MEEAGGVAACITAQRETINQSVTVQTRARRVRVSLVFQVSSGSVLKSSLFIDTAVATGRYALSQANVVAFAGPCQTRSVLKD